MALLKFLKKEKKGKEKKKKSEEKEKKVQTPINEVKSGKKEKDAPDAYRILKSPHISEKATNLTKEDQYVFEVFSGVNKTEIKKTIENLYGVNVLSVNLIKIPSKIRKRGRTTGFKKGYKKAIIKIKKGQKIEAFTP